MLELNQSVFLFSQGDGRTYSHTVTISCENDPEWEDLAYFARIIPKVCRNINRVCYAFGGIIQHIVKPFA